MGRVIGETGKEEEKGGQNHVGSGLEWGAGDQVVFVRVAWGLPSPFLSFSDWVGTETYHI